MKKYVSNSLKLLAGCMIGISIPSCFGLTSCSKSDAIEFANYESYMAESLMDDLHEHYNIHFPNYTVAEMIPAKFQRFYDCAVPCGYELMALLRNGWLEKVDWEKFQVKAIGGADVIKTADEARTLYVDESNYDGLEKMNSQFTYYIKAIQATDPNDKLIKVLTKDGTMPTASKNFNILNYGVPYFAQSYMFAYTGSELTFYHNNNGTPEETTQPTWADIFYTISPSNPKQDSRFQSKKIGMVDDARSFHDISRIVESIEDEESEITLDPISGADINRVQKTMHHITGKFENHKSSFVLNSDSQIVSRGLADRNGDQTAVLSWSGDTIYAAQGAEEFPAFTSDNFHIVKPYGATFDEIEFVVMNNKNLNNKVKHDNIYKVVGQICLSGCDKNATDICSKKDDRYEYWGMENWNTVMYTPMLKSVYNAVALDSTSLYWQEQIQESGYSSTTVEKLFIPILNGKNATTAIPHLYGKTLTPLQNSNNHWAWLEQRGKL